MTAPTSILTSLDLQPEEEPVDTSSSVLSEFSRTATIPSAPTTASAQRQSTSSTFSTSTSSALACNRLGYFECGAESPGCCPVGYACAAQEDLCIFPNPSLKVDYVGRCPGRDGYGACHEDVGGGCCPHLYACLNGGCMLTQKLTKTLTTWTETYYGRDAGSERVMAVSTWIHEAYPTSVNVFIDRLQSRPTTTSFPGAVVQVSRNDLSDVALAGIIVSCLFVASILFLGLFFFIRRQRKRRAKENRDGDDDDYNKRQGPLELAETSDVHEADTEKHKVEMSSNDRKMEAWELEDTSYLPELCPSPGVSDGDPETPSTKTDDRATSVTISPLSECHEAVNIPAVDRCRKIERRTSKFPTPQQEWLQQRSPEPIQ
ncbi:hypothetical protein QBC40DRAFT_294101 [Triangularia verruculosa]|uniref:Uncharacterized protein n=1 Tax=Triangularia verruculosa TaxID=2587418 RepID=A0AAN7AVX2_9PEZI|nr:hypothetical protein QBC40DRAFT_294101 [Triangularia verruculosa]